MLNQKLKNLLVYRFYLLDFLKSKDYTAAEEAWVQG